MEIPSSTHPVIQTGLLNQRPEPRRQQEDRASPDLARNGTSEPQAPQQREHSVREQQQLRALQARDREVRAHEAAHKAAGGHLASAASFSYQNGPDGRRYAVGGEVSIDVSKVPGDPQATLAKARQIRAAALAPATPSAQDRAVAAHANQMAAEARIEILNERQTQDTPQTQDTSAQNSAVPTPNQQSALHKQDIFSDLIGSQLDIFA